MTLNKDTEDELDRILLLLIAEAKVHRGMAKVTPEFDKAKAALHRLILKKRREALTMLKELNDHSDLTASEYELLIDAYIAQIDSELERSSDGN